MRVGATPPAEFTLRKKNTPSPLTTPTPTTTPNPTNSSPKVWNFGKAYTAKYPLFPITE